MNDQGTNVEDVWAAIVASVVELETRNRAAKGSIVKSHAQVALGHKIVESDYGFNTFKELAQSGATHSLFRLSQNTDEADFTLTSTDKEFRMLAEVVQHLVARGSTPMAAIVKPFLREALGGQFEEGALGYKNFKEFAMAAAASGHVDVQVDTTGDFRLSPLLPNATKTTNTDVDEASRAQAYRELRLTVLDQVNRPVPGLALGHLLSKRLGRFTVSDFGFKALKQFVAAAERAGEVRIITDPDWSDFRVDAVPVPLDFDTPSLSLEQAFEALRQVVVERHRKDESPFASAVKDHLLRTIPEFSERQYKYQRFGEFLQDAESSGYVSLRGRTGHGKTIIDVYPPDVGGFTFADIRFGYVSAGAESVREPDLLLQGFYDFQGVVAKLLERSEYLVLGYKGSGKSAIGEHLAKRAEVDPELFVDFIDLKDFPYGTLASLAEDDSSQQLLRLSWRWLLLLRVFQSLLADSGADWEHDVEAKQLAHELQKQGMIPSRSFSDMSIRSVNLAAKGGLPKLFEGAISGEFVTRQAQLTDVVGRIEALTTKYRTASKHMHVIDGLDELLTPDARTYSSLSALLGEVESLNDAFFRATSASKIILLCRSDLFERLSSPNKNKLRQNFSINLRWSPDWNENNGTELGGLIRQRALLSGYSGDDPVRDFLPFKAQATDDNIWSYLVGHTRQTPRDLIALLTKIQGHATRAAITSTEIQRGLNEYSSEYFVPELKDELAGYIAPDQIDVVFGVLAALKKRTFAMTEFAKLADARGIGIGIIDALDILFECSALGLDRSREGRDHEFKYMNSNLAINPTSPLIVHRGAWWALSLRT